MEFGVDRWVLWNAYPPLRWFRDKRLRKLGRRDARLGCPQNPDGQVLRFLGLFPGPDPQSPRQQRLAIDAAGHDLPRLKAAVELLRATLTDKPSVWLLVPILLILLVAETYGASLLLHDQGYADWTLYFLSCAFATALFALLAGAVGLAKKGSRLVWLAIPALTLVAIAITANRQQGEEATWADAIIVLVATVGPAALVEVVFTKLKETLPFWRRLRLAIQAHRKALRTQRRAIFAQDIIERSGKWWKEQEGKVKAEYDEGYVAALGKLLYDRARREARGAERERGR
jgi:hypothetical protein